jgi:hypothetical protein
MTEPSFAVFKNCIRFGVVYMVLVGVSLGVSWDISCAVIRKPPSFLVSVVKTTSRLRPEDSMEATVIWMQPVEDIVQWSFPPLPVVQSILKTDPSEKATQMIFG